MASGDEQPVSSFRRSSLLLSFAQLFSTAALGVTQMVGIMGYAAYDLQGSVSLMTVVVLLSSVATIVGQLFSGSLIDRVGPKHAGALSNLLFLVVCAGMQFVGSSVAGFLAIVLLQGFAVGFLTTIFIAFVPYIAAPEHFPRLNSDLSVMRYAAYLLGPLQAGFLMRTFSIQVLFLVSAGYALIALALMVAIPLRASDKPAPAPKRRSPFAGALGGMTVVRRTPKVLMATTMLVVSWFTWGAFDPLETLYFKDVVGLSVDWLAWIAFFSGAGSLVSSLVFRFIPLERQTVLTQCVLVGALALATLVYIGTKQVFWVSVGSLLTGVFFGLIDPLFNTILQRHVAIDKVGRVAGATKALGRIASIVPYAFVPSLSAAFGVQPVLIGAACLALAGSVVLTLVSAKSAELAGA